MWEHPSFQPSLWIIIFHNMWQLFFLLHHLVFPEILIYEYCLNMLIFKKQQNSYRNTTIHISFFFPYSKFYQQLLKVLAYSYFINVTIISWRVKTNCMNTYVTNLCNVTRNNINLQPYKTASMTHRNVFFFFLPWNIWKIILMPSRRNMPPHPSQGANVWTGF